MVYFIDTSAILEGALSLYNHSHIYLSPLVLMELENLKTNGNENIKFRARKAIRTIIQSEIAMTTISQKKSSSQRSISLEIIQQKKYKYEKTSFFGTIHYR